MTSQPKLEDAMAAFVVVLVFSVIIFAFVSVFRSSSQQIISSGGLISSGDDFAFVQNSIEWGTLAPDETKTVTVPMTEKVSGLSYSVAVSNWSSKEASELIEVSWAKGQGHMNFTLHVAPVVGNLTSFSMDITVTSS